VLDVRNLTVEIDTRHGTIQPVRGVSFTVRAGETLAMVGESGSGKSLTGLAIMGVLPPSAHVSQGSAWLQGHNLLRLDNAAFRRVRGGVMSMIFPDPLSSLNPVHRTGAQIAEVMRAHFDVPHYEAKEEVEALLGRVGMPDPDRQARAYPHELSDDMRQRAMIAMAIANDPRLLIADEPVAALDATDQAQLLELLADLRRELGMGMVLISKSLHAAAGIADRVVVMHAGEVVEQGAPREIFATPLHPYTAALMHNTLGDGRTPHALPPGCAFAPRCRYTDDLCTRGDVPVTLSPTGAMVRCVRTVPVPAQEVSA
jgi:peptide/nickel transport system permease protein